MIPQDHAQLIYAHLLSGCVAAGKPLPLQGDTGLMEMSLAYAKAFHQHALGKKD